MTDAELGRYKVNSPRDLIPLGHQDLLELLAMNPESTVADWIRDELHRRHLGAIADEVKLLTASSTKLEGLTVRLNWLTWVLIALTAAAVGIEIWKSSHEPPSVSVTGHPEPWR